jgi:hypothetical protein
MGTRRLYFGAAVASLLLLTQSASAATFTTTNFVVTAATPELARQFGEAAEHWRIVKAKEWLGQEMPNWPQRCPLRVDVSNEGPSGATTFDFQQQPLYQFMQIKGPKERLLNSVLPHEVTHTVFAHYFRQPVPRWADEGGAVLSEDDLERGRHDQMCRQLLNAGHAFRLAHLFALRDYPRDMMVLYAEGFSVSRYLVDSKDRTTFLRFVEQGMKQGWDRSVQANYGYQNVNDLEAAWIDSLRKPRNVTIASNAREGAARGSSAELTSQSVVRTTSPPALPELGPPTIRGSSANLGSDSERFGGNAKPVSSPNPPGFDPIPTQTPATAAALPPLPPPIPLPAEPVRLGTPSLGLMQKK